MFRHHTYARIALCDLIPYQYTRTYTILKLSFKTLLRRSQLCSRNISAQGEDAGHHLGFAYRCMRFLGQLWRHMLCMCLCVCVCFCLYVCGAYSSVCVSVFVACSNSELLPKYVYMYTFKQVTCFVVHVFNVWVMPVCRYLCKSNAIMDGSIPLSMTIHINISLLIDGPVPVLVRMIVFYV